MLDKYEKCVGMRTCNYRIVLFEPGTERNGYSDYYISKTTNETDIEGSIKLSNMKRAVLGSHRTPLEDGNFLRSLARLLLGRNHAGRGKRHGVSESRGCRRPSFSPVGAVTS